MCYKSNYSETLLLVRTTSLYRKYGIFAVFVDFSCGFAVFADFSCGFSVFAEISSGFSVRKKRQLGNFTVIKSLYVKNVNFETLQL